MENFKAIIAYKQQNPDKVLLLLAISDPLPNTYQIVGHTQQFDGPIITEKFACLDCRAAFSLDQKARLKPVTRL